MSLDHVLDPESILREARRRNAEQRLSDEIRADTERTTLETYRDEPELYEKIFNKPYPKNNSPGTPVTSGYYPDSPTPSYPNIDKEHSSDGDSTQMPDNSKSPSMEETISVRVAEQLFAQLNGLLSPIQQDINNLKTAADKPVIETSAASSVQQSEIETPNSNYDDEEAELNQFFDQVHAVNPDSQAGKRIDAFNRLVVRIPKPASLTGEHTYQLWAESVEVAAQQAGVQVVLRQEEPRSSSHSILAVWWTYNDWLFGLMLRSLSPQALSHITVPEERLASKLWSLLRDTFAERPETRRRKIVSDILSLSPKSCGSDKAFVENVLGLRAELRRLGRPWDDYLLFDLVVLRISPNWKHLLLRWQEQASTPEQLPEAKFPESLRNLLARMDAMPRVAATPRDQHIGDSHTNKDFKKPNASPFCGHCNKTGHTNASCYLLHPEKRPPNTQRSTRHGMNGGEAVTKQDHVHCVTDEVHFQSESQMPPKTESTIEWILDTGAGQNSTYLVNRIQQSSPPLSDHSLRTANGSTAKVHAIVNVNIPMDSGTLTLNDVRLVPELEVNVISLGQLLQKGYTMSHDIDDSGTHVLYVRSSDKLSCLTASLRHDNIFIVNETLPNYPPSQRAQNLLSMNLPSPILSVMEEVNSQNTSFLSRGHSPNRLKTDTLANWHRRTGHLNAQDLLLLSRNPQSGIKIKGTKELGFCDVCVRAKAKALSHPPSKRYINPGARIHLDIGGGGRTLDTTADNEISTFGGGKNFMVLTGDATRYRWLYVLKSRAEAFNVITRFIKQIKSLTGRSIRIMHSDRAGELISEKLSAFYHSEGVTMEVSPSYSHQSNGTSERAVQLVSAKMRALLFEAQLPMGLWGEAAVAAVFQLNMSPTSTDIYGCIPDSKPITPFEAWTGLAANISWMKRWGSVAYMKELKPSLTTSKLTARTTNKTLYLVGYHDDRVMRLYDSDSQQIFVTRDAYIDEGLAPAVPSPLAIQEETPPMQMDADPLVTTIHETDGLYASTDISEEAKTQDTPESLEEAKRSPEWSQWRAAMEEESANQRRMGVYSMVNRADLPQDTKVLNGRWVFARKLDNNGDTTRFKARWVVRGCHQIKDIHYSQTFAAVVNATTTRTLIAVAAAKQWQTRVVDFVAAFLNGKLPEEEMLHVQLPTGLKHGRGQLVGLLRQGLYGLKQSARLWYNTLTSKLQSLGFRISPYDAGLLIHDSRKLYLTLHVDDCRITGHNSADIEWTISELSKSFELKDVTASGRYLGVQVTPSKEGTTISQPAYIDELLDEFQMHDCHPKNTPMETGLVLDFSSNNEDESDHEFTPSRYRQGMGALQFLVTSTRPDIAYAVNYLARFNSRPNRACWLGFKRILRYLKGTRSH